MNNNNNFIICFKKLFKIYSIIIYGVNPVFLDVVSSHIELIIFQYVFKTILQQLGLLTLPCNKLKKLLHNQLAIPRQPVKSNPYRIGSFGK